MQYVKDPLQVKYYEKILGRHLTQEEKLGEKAVVLQGQKVYLELTDIQFPFGFMTITQLHSYYATRKK